jgi:hypothetical protein
MNDKLSKIYQYLSSQNVANLPATQDDFNTMMQDDSKASKVHQYLLSQNVANVDSDFNTFKDYIGLQKKKSLSSRNGYERPDSATGFWSALKRIFNSTITIHIG